MTKSGSSVVQRQGMRHGLVSILSMILGVFNNLFVYPKYLVLYGFFQSINALAQLLGPFGQYGLNVVLIKYHDELLDNNSNGMFRYAVRWLCISSMLLVAIMVFFLDPMIQNLKSYLPNVEYLGKYRWQILAITILSNIIITLSAISAVFKEVALPHFLHKIVNLKILVPIVIVISSLYVVDSEFGVLYGFIIAMFVVIVVMLIVFASKGQLAYHKKEISTPFKEVFSFASFGILDKTSSNLAFSIDIIMVKMLLGDAVTGIYAIFNFLANVLRIPISAVDGIYNPIVAELWKQGKLNQLKVKYENASIALFILTLGLFLFIDLSIHDILSLINKESSSVGRFVFLYIGIGILIDSMTMMNSHILVYSESYKWNLYFTIFSALVNIVLTYIFIQYVFKAPVQAAGAACSTAISLIIFNVAKTTYIYIKYGLQPFSMKHLKVIVLGATTYIVVHFMPLEFYAFWNIVFRSVLVVILFGLPVYFLKISKDVNDLVDKTLLSRFF